MSSETSLTEAAKSPPLEIYRDTYIKLFLTGESALGQVHQPDDVSQSLKALFSMTCIDLQATHHKVKIIIKKSR